MMALRKVRDVRRQDLPYVLINPNDFDSEFHTDIETEQQPEIETVNPIETPNAVEIPAVEAEPKPRKVRKEEVNSDG